MSYRNICVEYKAKKAHRSNYYEYALRRCSKYEVFWNME